MDIERSLGVIAALDEHQISHPVLSRSGSINGLRRRLSRVLLEFSFLASGAELALQAVPGIDVLT